MTAQTSAVPSENWDDDFEFSQSNSTNNPKHGGSRKPEQTIIPPFEPRLSVASSRFSEDWDADDGLRHPSPKAPVAKNRRAPGSMNGTSNRLNNWAEPGPSTPTKRGDPQVPTENWDDDFEDKADSPHRRHQPHRASHHVFQHHHHTHALRTRHSYHTPPRLKPPAEPENWDDDFDDPMDPTSSTSPTRIDDDNTPVTKRTRRQAYADTSDEDEEADFGLSEDKEEDKTLTAHSRTAPMRRPGSSNSHLHTSFNHSSLPPVPTLPQSLSPSPIEPFPRSPTVSVFSIPTTSGRNSIGHFNSTSHLVLSGAASSLGMLPPSPPTAQRERRRLRKKSRPPNMDNNVFELIEEQRDSSSPPLPPSTPERERASSPAMVPMVPSSSVEATPSGGPKTPLLSRIGSVKKWGVRRKRASTGPPEVMMQDFGTSSAGVVEQETTPRPPSSLEQTQAQTPSKSSRNDTGGMRSTWFFRPGGAHYGAGSPSPGHADSLKHEKSLDQAHLRPGVGGSEGGGHVPTTPSKSKRLSRRKASGLLLDHASSSDLTGDGSSSASGAIGLGKPSLGLGRRPTSMQVPGGVALAAGAGSNKFSSIGTRHASYGSSIGRMSSSRVFSTPTPTESMEDLPPMPALPLQEGSRSFMGSVRKISLVGGKKHKKKKSSADITCVSHQDDGGDVEDGELNPDGDARMQTHSGTHTHDLLPPIELHPPSPPRTIIAARSIALNISDGIEPMIPSTSAPASITMIPVATLASSSSKATPKTPSSPQSASLGRAAQVPNPSLSNASMPRRNSLGDLKIPARISQAQIGLKRDLGMVREFATSVDNLKELQSIHHYLLAQARILLESAPPSRATSPSMLSLVRPRSRLRSNTSPPSNTSSGAPGSFSEYKHIAAALHAITVKYKISWECAELLVELGGGASSPVAAPSSSVSAPVMSMEAELFRQNRERAITLSGEDPKLPAVALVGGTTASSSTSGPPNVSWRASTGRHDLSQRQLVLLRDMLNNGEHPHDDVPLLEENVNRNWRWGDAMSSTVTLPSEESGSRGADHGGESTKKKRRGRRMGLTGLRDILRMLKWSHSEQVPTSPVPDLPVGPSTASLSTESSHYSHHYPHGQLGLDGVHGTSIGPESARSTKDTSVNSPYSGPALHHKSSPRRPSLASIFRIGQKNKGGMPSSTGESSQDSRSDVRSASRGSNMTGDEDDWDRVESAIDLDTTARAFGIEGTATIKGRKGRMSPFLSENHGHASGLTHRPVTPRRIQGSVQALRIEVEASPRSIRPMRSTRLSNVEEVEDGERQDQLDAKVKNHVPRPRTSPHRPPSRGAMPVGNRTGSVRSAPSQPLAVEDPLAVPEIKLSMTPENIRPLLESAKEVYARCHECLRELRALLDAMSTGSPTSTG